MDRDLIQRRDFPTGRRGYDISAVDEHLRAVADAFEHNTATPAVPSLAATTSAQVREILEAAERSVAEVRAQAGAEAADQVSRVQVATDGMLAQLDHLESELTRLLSALRTSGERLTEGLAQLQSDVAAGIPPAVPDFPPAAMTPPAPADVPPASTADAPPTRATDAPTASPADAPPVPAADAPPMPSAEAPPAPANHASSPAAATPDDSAPARVADTPPAPATDSPPAPAAAAPASDSPPPAADPMPAAAAAPTSDPPPPAADPTPAPVAAAPTSDSPPAPDDDTPRAPDDDPTPAPAAAAPADDSTRAAISPASAGDTPPVPAPAADLPPAPGDEPPLEPAKDARAATNGHDAETKRRFPRRRKRAQEEETPPAPQPTVDDAATLFDAPQSDDDGARLIALNMALSGESREETARFLEEHFDLEDLDDLLDDVFTRAGR